MKMKAILLCSLSLFLLQGCTELAALSMKRSMECGEDYLSSSCRVAEQMYQKALEELEQCYMDLSEWEKCAAARNDLDARYCGTKPDCE